METRRYQSKDESDKIAITEILKEELARHMQFARKRKKQVLHDALNYYNGANNLGYEPAQDRIKYLKEKLKIN